MKYLTNYVAEIVTLIAIVCIMHITQMSLYGFAAIILLTTRGCSLEGTTKDKMVTLLKGGILDILVIPSVFVIALDLVIPLGYTPPAFVLKMYESIKLLVKNGIPKKEKKESSD